MLSKSTRLLVPLLFFFAVAQLTLLYATLIVPEISQIGRGYPDGNIISQISRGWFPFLENKRESDSLELSRSLKNHALAIQEHDRAKAKSELKEALLMQKRHPSATWQVYLDSMESIDTLDFLSDLEIRDGNVDIARDLLKECFLLAKKDHIYWQTRPIEKYLKLLQGSARKSESEEVLSYLKRWQSVPISEFRRYIQSKKEALKHLPAGLEHGAAIPFLADFNRRMERNFALAGRMKEALFYAEHCVRMDSLLPQSSWQKPTDLAELALVFTELGQLTQASSTYRDCINLIIQGPNPDVLPILPQRLALANLALDLGRSSDYVQAIESSEDIMNFLEELKHQDKPFPADRQWKKGDLIQVLWDDRWWSGVVIELEENQGSTVSKTKKETDSSKTLQESEQEKPNTQRLRIHFVGFPSTQDDWFETREVRQHPPYGFANPQGLVPEFVWTILNQSFLH